MIRASSTAFPLRAVIPVGRHQTPVRWVHILRIVAPLAGRCFFNRMTSLCFSPQFPCSSRNPFGQGHSTPIKIQLNGRPQILLLSARVTNAERGSDQAPERSLELAKSGHGGVLSSSDPNTGELLWESYAPACSSPVAPPLRVFVTGGCRAGSDLLEITEVDGAFSVAEVFRHPQGS